MKPLLTFSALSILCWAAGMAAHWFLGLPGWAMLPGVALCALSGVGFGLYALALIGGGLTAAVKLPFRGRAAVAGEVKVPKAAKTRPAGAVRVEPTF